MPAVLTIAVDVGDADSTRTVWAIVALLVVMGLALVMLAFWIRRTTRPDPEFLAPLELMDDRSWRRGDAVWQRRRLDEVRPEGASPLARPAAPPRLDESFDAGPAASGFDDLHDDVHGPDVERDEHADHDADDRSNDAVVDDGARTPTETARPPLDQLPEGDVDESALRRALEELDAELERGGGDR